MYKIIIDFETRSECDLKSHGAWIYSKHPSTEILCMGYIISENKQILKSGIVDNFYDSEFFRFFRNNLKYIKLLAHNAFFEQCLYYNILIPLFEWPLVSHDQWYCTASKAAAYALPRSLEPVSEELNLDHKKNLKGHKLMLKMCKPRKPKKSEAILECPNLIPLYEQLKSIKKEIRSTDRKALNFNELIENQYVIENHIDDKIKCIKKIFWYDSPEDMEYLKQYCLDDVKAEFALDLTIRDLSPFEQKIWWLDQKINFRGLYIDIILVKKAIKLLKNNSIPINKKIAEITNNEVIKISQTKKLLKWCNDQLNDDFQLENLSKTTLPTYLKTNDKYLPTDVIEALNLRLSSAKTSTAKFKAISNYTDKDNRVRGSLLYHGAATGRWSGSGIQPQNLPKGISGLDIDKTIDNIKFNENIIVNDELFSELSSCIRGCIIASPGKKLLCGDYASIEARILFFESQEEQALNIFKNNEDIYCDLASDIYCRIISKKNKDERFLGKQGILGLGYGMGAPKFKATCDSYGVTISDELSKKVVDTYRKKYLKVVKFWREIENAAIQAVLTGKIQDVNNIRYKKVGKFLHCRLPSGRLLSYFKPRIIETQYGYSLEYRGLNSITKKFEMLKTYGGKLVENICQGIARDIMADAMLRLEQIGYPVILTVHDEILCEVNVDSDRTLDEFLNILSTPPIWAIDCPLAVEGWEGDRYKK